MEQFYMEKHKCALNKFHFCQLDELFCLFLQTGIFLLNIFSLFSKLFPPTANIQPLFLLFFIVNLPLKISVQDLSPSFGSARLYVFCFRQALTQGGRAHWGAGSPLGVCPPRQGQREALLWQPVWDIPCPHKGTVLRVRESKWTRLFHRQNPLSAPIYSAVNL